MSPSFYASSFAVAGALAAAGPIIIHLLNRRRFRVVEWAAMDFLKQALQRNRKLLQLRDLLLLALRVACVALFGLALARPYFSSSAAVAGKSGPVHAVLILDNSMSMGYEQIDGTLLDEARRKAEEFIEQLPPGSRISVAPLCGSEAAYTLEPYRSLQDARDALKKVHVVDRVGTGAQAADLALQACEQAPDLPAKRVVFLGDQQNTNWPHGSLSAQLAKLPEMQIVHIAAENPENAWVSEFRVQDGIADVETPTMFFATISYAGQSPRSNVQVTLAVDNVTVASRTVDLEPGQSREIQFPYRFDMTTEPGRVTFIPASVTIQADTVQGDRLRADNQRFLAVPVVAALPVVFVDQFGEKEDRQRNQYGETFLVRRLLAPLAARSDAGKQLIQIRHTTIDKVDKALLEDARLVVIAGVQSPESAVPVLREYVEQGGQLCLAAGARFDPRAWNEGAWLEGSGILPAPLRPEPVGQLPEEATSQLEPFQLASQSLVHDYFKLEDNSPEALADLYYIPLFFKAVAADVTRETVAELLKHETQRITENREFLAASEQRLKLWDELEAKGAFGPAEQQQRAADEARRGEIAPRWLLWKKGQLQDDRGKSPADLAERTTPHALAEFTKERLPFIIERKIGQGQVVFIASGLFTDWNNMITTDAAVVFDRILRSMLQETVPKRNLESEEQITLPVDSGDRRIQYTLTRPSGVKESLTMDALGPDTYGIAIRNVTQAGHYLVTAQRESEALGQSEGKTDADAKLWQVPLAVNSPERESQLETLDASRLKERLGDANYRWVERDEQISLEGAQIYGQNLWKWLMFLVLACLLMELLVLAWPVRAKERAV